MSVYVDDANIPFGRMIMCHMIADTEEELLAMADKIGVARKWIQRTPGKPWRTHFDICLAKRKMAVSWTATLNDANKGPIEVTIRPLRGTKAVAQVLDELRQELAQVKAERDSLQRQLDEVRE